MNQNPSFHHCDCNPDCLDPLPDPLTDPLNDPLADPLIDNDVYLGDRIYVEEVGYWGLLPMQERENEYGDVCHSNYEKYFG